MRSLAKKDFKKICLLVKKAILKILKILDSLDDGVDMGLEWRRQRHHALTLLKSSKLRIFRIAFLTNELVF